MSEQEKTVNKGKDVVSERASEEQGRSFKPIIVKMPKKEEKSKFKLFELLGRPNNLLFLGALLIAIAYALYPFRANSMIPGLLIGGGVAGLIWVAFRVIYR